MLAAGARVARLNEYYRMGFEDGYNSATEQPEARHYERRGLIKHPRRDLVGYEVSKPKRKLSAWNKFVKANSRKKEFRYRDGKLNLKKMGVAFRRKKRR